MLSTLLSRIFKHGEEDHVVHSDITNGREKNKIPAVSSNCRDTAPNDYHYVTEDVEGTPMSVDRSLGTMNSCDCDDNCSDGACKCTNTYNSIPCYRDGKLSPDYNFDQPEVIYECNIGCKCKLDCQNRVIQRGTDLKLILFKTQNRGWGIKTMRTIKKGTFIGVYSGELITTEESCKRQDDTYLFNLSFTKKTKDEQQYVCDAKFYGNFTRFINHSCQPNVIGIRSFTVHQDSKFPHIAFFALDKIPAKSELTLNYGDNYWLVKCKRDKQYCLCKKASCRFTKRTFPATYREAAERKKKEEEEEEEAEERAIEEEQGEGLAEEILEDEQYIEDDEDARAEDEEIEQQNWQQDDQVEEDGGQQDWHQHQQQQEVVEEMIEDDAEEEEEEEEAEQVEDMGEEVEDFEDAKLHFDLPCPTDTANCRNVQERNIRETEFM